MSVVLDSSALLAAIRGEPGAERVRPLLNGARVSAVNFSEVVAKLAERGATDEELRAFADGAPFAVIPFDSPQALATGLLRRATRHSRLSLGDRACLALARTEGLPAVTADRAWAGIDLGIPVEVVR